MKRILIEWSYCDREGSSCPKCSEGSGVIKAAIETMRPFLRTMQVQLDLREVRPTGDQPCLSNRVKINGKKIFEGGMHETVPREMLVDAILKEAGRFARSGCGSNPEDLFR